MRNSLLKRIKEVTLPAMPRVNLKCEDRHCTHKNCLQDPETGEWYKTEKIPLTLEEGEAVPALLLAQAQSLRSIKNMLAFFTVLTVLGLLFWLISLLNLGRLFRWL